MSLFKLLTCLATIGISLTAFAQDDAILATIGTKKITKKEFEAKYKEVVEKTVNPPPRNLFLEDLVRYEVGVLEAENRKLDQDPIVKERFRQLMYVDLIEKEIGQKVENINITEKDLEKYYKNNPEIRSSHILIELKDKATAKEREIARKRAGEIYKEVVSSKRPFAELVKLYSDDVISKKNGGDIGWHSSVTLLPEYYNSALKLKAGQLSNLVETKFGFHIIKNTGRRDFKDADKMQIRAGVLNEKKRDLLNSFFSKLKSKYSIKVNSKNL